MVHVLCSIKVTHVHERSSCSTTQDNISFPCIAVHSIFSNLTPGVSSSREVPEFRGRGPPTGFLNSLKVSLVIITIKHVLINFNTAITNTHFHTIAHNCRWLWQEQALLMPWDTWTPWCCYIWIYSHITYMYMRMYMSSLTMCMCTYVRMCM